MVDELLQISKEHGGILRFIQVSCLGASPSSPSRMLRAKAAAEEAVLRELPEVHLFFSLCRLNNLFRVPLSFVRAATFHSKPFTFEAKVERLGNESSHVEFPHDLVMRKFFPSLFSLALNRSDLTKFLSIYESGRH